LQSLPDNIDELMFMLDEDRRFNRRLNPGKLRNWRRRYRGEIDGIAMVLPQGPEVQGESYVINGF
jgi:hypothetical protein